MGTRSRAWRHWARAWPAGLGTVLGECNPSQEESCSRLVSNHKGKRRRALPLTSVRPQARGPSQVPPPLKEVGSPTSKCPQRLLPQAAVPTCKTKNSERSQAHSKHDKLPFAKRDRCVEKEKVSSTESSRELLRMADRWSWAKHEARMACLVGHVVL